LKTVVFLGLDEVITIHDHQTKKYGGHSGIRDVGLLHSAVATPSVSFGGEYLHPNVYEMAAVYLFHIIKNHAFMDGNKRTGAVSAMVFLRLNGIQVDVEKGGIERLALSVAEGNLDKTAIASFFRNNAFPLSKLD
jgi:death on curing protein